VDLSNELQQKSKHIDEMIENRKENIGVIERKTGDILANIDDVKDVVIKHLNEVADKMKEKVTSSNHFIDMLTFLLQFIGQVHGFR
jgi:hypothetical protein